jgi:hypothetical protein
MNAKLIFNDIKEFMTIIDWLSTYNDERQNLFLIVFKKNDIHGYWQRTVSEIPIVYIILSELHGQ